MRGSRLFYRHGRRRTLPAVPCLPRRHRLISQRPPKSRRRGRPVNIRRPRPTSVLVLGILSLLFGFSFGVQGCAGKGMTFFWAAFEKHLPPQMQPPDPNNPNAPQAPQAGADPMMLAQLKLIRDDPSFLPITTAFFVTFMLAGLLQCVAGIGLIMMKNWGRVLAILTALLILVT